MQALSALAAVMAALGVGVVSPGPSFVMVARTAVVASRRHGIAAALGMGVGGLAFAVCALFGLQAALIAVPTLYLVLKVAGGAYLVYLGCKIWQVAANPLVDAGLAPVAPDRWRRSFALGLATQLSNPKTAIVYASVFAAFLPAQPTAAFDAALIVSVFVVEASWYSFVALALSAVRPRSAYLRFKAPVDRTAGGVMVLLGLKLVLSGYRPGA